MLTASRAPRATLEHQRKTTGGKILSPRAKKEQSKELLLASLSQPFHTKSLEQIRTCLKKGRENNKTY